MRPKVTFITIGDIAAIATMKRALGMANPLHELGWDVSIIAMDCEENRRRIQMECNDNIKIHFYTAGDINNEVGQKTALVKKIAPDFIYFCSFSARNRISKAKADFKGKVIIEHSELPSAIRNKSMSRRVLDFAMEKYSILYADMLVGASVYLVSFYKKQSRKLLKGKMPVDYSPYAFNDDVINAAPVIFDELKERYKGKTVFLYMGTMTRNYGLFTMIEAAEALSKTETRNFVLLMLGGGPDLNEAKQYVQDKGLGDIIYFTGYTPEEYLSSYFSLADAFISPLNNTIQDIARCPSKIYMYLPFKKPVLTCKLGEPFQIFGEEGYYFDNENPQSLSSLMKLVVEKSLKGNAISIAEHSWKQRAVDFNNWIQSLNRKR